jgi:hypothetical protein
MNSCFLYYKRSTNTVNLLNNAGTGYASGTIGSAGTLSNSQCSIALGSSSVSTPAALTVNLAMTFAGSFAGAKNIYMDVVTNAGTSAGWADKGDWTVPAGGGGGLSAVSVTPNTGSGLSQTFVFAFEDPAGFADIATTWMWFTPTFSTSAGAFVNTCFMYYQRSTNTLNLLNNAGNGYVSGTLGSGSISNGQCSINLAGSSRTTSGNSLSLSLPVTFTSATFAGAKNVFMDVVTNTGASSGWPDRGDWTVP